MRQWRPAPEKPCRVAWPRYLLALSICLADGLLGDGFGDLGGRSGGLRRHRRARLAGGVGFRLRRGFLRNRLLGRLRRLRHSLYLGRLRRRLNLGRLRRLGFPGGALRLSAPPCPPPAPPAAWFPPRGG